MLDPRNVESPFVVWEPKVVLTHYMQPNPQLSRAELVEACGGDIDKVDTKHQLSSTDLENIIELAAREGYASLGVGRDSEEHHQNLIRDMHVNPAYHATMSFRISGVSRDCLHQLNRHNVGIQRTERSFRFLHADVSRVPAQIVMPQRFIITDDTDEADLVWMIAAQHNIIEGFKNALNLYNAMLPHGVKSSKRAIEAARSILPGGVATSQRITLNLTALINLIQKRAASAEHDNLLMADLEIARLVYKMWEVAYPLAPNYLEPASSYMAKGLDFGPWLEKPEAPLALLNTGHW